jgi:hypothetical protein
LGVCKQFFLPEELLIAHLRGNAIVLLLQRRGPRSLETECHAYPFPVSDVLYSWTWSALLSLTRAPAFEALPTPTPSETPLQSPSPYTPDRHRPHGRHIEPGSTGLPQPRHQREPCQRSLIRGTRPHQPRVGRSCPRASGPQSPRGGRSCERTLFFK